MRSPRPEVRAGRHDRSDSSTASDATVARSAGRRRRILVGEMPRFPTACHCSRCRKLGSPPFAIVRAEEFELHSSEDAIVRWQPTAPFQYVRSSCGRCGTSLLEIGSGGETRTSR